MEIFLLILGIVQLLVPSLGQVSPESISNKNGKQLHSNSLLSPRMEYDDWTPLGHGDPLKNDPTYDYVPPMLDKVKYWISDGDTKKHANQALKNNDILLLGVSSLKKSTAKPNKKHTPERTNLLNPTNNNQKNSVPAKVSHKPHEKDPNLIENQHSTNEQYAGLATPDNFLQDSSQMNFEKRTDPLETLLQLVSSKWNMPFSTTPSKPMPALQQTQILQHQHHQQQHQQVHQQQQQQVHQQQQLNHQHQHQQFNQQHQQQQFNQQHQQQQFNQHQQQQLHQQQLFTQQQQLKQQYEQQLVKVPDIMLIPPVDTTNSNTWFLTEPTDNQLFTRAQNISNFKPADNVTNSYDLVTQNHFVTPANYDVQTSLKFHDVITQTNYPLVYQSNISSYTPISSITPTTFKAQEITPTSYKPQDTPTLGNSITSIDYKVQSHVPFITPIGLKIQNIPTPSILKQNEIPVTHPKLQSSVTPINKLQPLLSSVTPINLKQNTLFVTPLVYKTNYITEPAKLSHTNWITPSAPSVYSVPLKFTTPANQFFIKHSTSTSPNLKIQNYQTFPHWKLAQNQVFHNNPKFTPNPQHIFKHTDLFPATKPSNVQANTLMSTTVVPPTIVFCNQTNYNVSLDDKKEAEKYPASNKTLPVVKQSFPSMNLIIQGHSKVKKYGAAKIDKVSGIAIQEDNKIRKSRSLHSRKGENFTDALADLDLLEEVLPVITPGDYYEKIDDNLINIEQYIEDLGDESSGYGEVTDTKVKSV